MEARRIIESLKLEPHPEGGFYRETYRSDERIDRAALPGRYGGDRALSTAILFLVTNESFSALHRLNSDEIFHFHLGDAADLLVLLPDGSVHETRLGPDIGRGDVQQAVVRRGVWQGLRVVPGGRWTLVGATVAPGFDFSDLEMGSRDDLVMRYPAAADRIRLFTR